jgi:hypothetical protein
MRGSVIVGLPNAQANSVRVIVGRRHLADQGVDAAGRPAPAHLDQAVERMARLHLGTDDPPVPEHGARSPVTQVAEPHGVEIGGAGGADPVAEAHRIGEAEALLVAAGAGGPVVGAQPQVVEQHPPERRHPVIAGFDAGLLSSAATVSSK